MSNPKYLRNSLHGLLGHAVEECGEVAAAIGKSIRWGLNSYNPELPPAQQEENGDWILRELADLDLATSRLRKALLKKGFSLPPAGPSTAPLAKMEKP